MTVTAIITCMLEDEASFVSRAVCSVLDQTVKCRVRLYTVMGNSWLPDIEGLSADVEVRPVPLAYAAAIRNLGAREATTEFVSFLDADDVWMPEKTSLQLEAMRSFECDLVGGDHYLIDVNDRRFAYGTARFLPMTSSWMVRRDYMLANPFDESLYYCEDGEWWLRTLPTCNRRRLPRFVIAYRVRDESKSTLRSAKKRKLMLKRLSGTWTSRNFIRASSYAWNLYHRSTYYDMHSDWHNISDALEEIRKLNVVGENDG